MSDSLYLLSNYVSNVSNEKPFKLQPIAQVSFLSRTKPAVFVSFCLIIVLNVIEITCQTGRIFDEIRGV